MISGEIFDVAIDIRKSSKNFGKYKSVKLSKENKKQFWIPEGFAHGFLILSDEAEILYKTTNYYNKSFERIIKWNDEDLKINWPIIEEPILSPKDMNGEKFSQAKLFE